MKQHLLFILLFILAPSAWSQTIEQRMEFQSYQASTSFQKLRIEVTDSDTVYKVILDSTSQEVYQRIDLTGDYMILTKEGKPLLVGDFVDGRLIYGRKYFWNEFGYLDHTEENLNR